MRRRQAEREALVPEKWEDRIRHLFGDYIWHDLSEPHKALWEWVDAIAPGTPPRPFIAVWPRGRGKSTHAEIAVADLAMRRRRSYVMYVSETQELADKHVSTVQSMLTSPVASYHYPATSNPQVGKHGNRTWRRSLLKTAAGVSVEGVGLDRAVRGQKINWARPDLIVFDDVDAKHDGPGEVDRKESVITTSILPAGASDCAVLFVQNLIHDGSIASRLISPSGEPGAADYLADRIVSGPYPAVEDLAYEYMELGSGLWRWKVLGGRSLWEGFTLEAVEEELNRVGPAAFELESQHAVHADLEGAMLSTDDIDASRVHTHPALDRIVIGIDPPGGSGEAGIVAVGRGVIGKVVHGFTIADDSQPSGTQPADWARAVLRLYHAVQADELVVETNFGGDMAKGVIRSVKLLGDDGEVLVDGETVPIVEVSASRGKHVRAQPVASLFQMRRAHHVGRFPKLQYQWTHWLPGTLPSPDRLDAEVWAYTRLMLVGLGRTGPRSGSPNVIMPADIFG